jgi:Papain fold toxin 2
MQLRSLHPQITEIASRFQRFECVDCASAVQQFLSTQNIPGTQIFLFTGSTQKPFCNIYCDRLQQNISINGRHTAIAVDIDGQELIFDNIHPQGISRVNWINSFYCPIQDLGGNFQLTETEF